MDQTYSLNGACKPTTKRFADLDGPDFYPTPAWATFALIDNERFVGDIWEPACGDGAMSAVLAQTGNTVHQLGSLRPRLRRERARLSEHAPDLRQHHHQPAVPQRRRLRRHGRCSRPAARSRCCCGWLFWKAATAAGRSTGRIRRAGSGCSASASPSIRKARSAPEAAPPPTRGSSGTGATPGRPRSTGCAPGYKAKYGAAYPS